MTASDKEPTSDKRQASVVENSDTCIKTNDAKHINTHLSSDNVCLPFVIQYKEGVGNFVVANRDIEPNEVEF